LVTTCGKNKGFFSRWQQTSFVEKAQLCQGWDKIAETLKSKKGIATKGIGAYSSQAGVISQKAYR
jgi:hypothetical protein